MFTKYRYIVKNRKKKKKNLFVIAIAEVNVVRGNLIFGSPIYKKNNILKKYKNNN